MGIPNLKLGGTNQISVALILLFLVDWGVSGDIPSSLGSPFDRPLAYECLRCILESNPQNEGMAGGHKAKHFTRAILRAILTAIPKLILMDVEPVFGIHKPQNNS